MKSSPNQPMEETDFRILLALSVDQYSTEEVHALIFALQRCGEERVAASTVRHHIIKLKKRGLVEVRGRVLRHRNLAVYGLTQRGIQVLKEDMGRRLVFAKAQIQNEEIMKLPLLKH